MHVESNPLTIELSGPEIGTIRLLAWDRAKRTRDRPLKQSCNRLGRLASHALEAEFSPHELRMQDSDAQFALATLFWYVEQVQHLDDAPLINEGTQRISVAMYLAAKEALDSVVS